jgi:hypothetical protein
MGHETYQYTVAGGYALQTCAASSGTSSTNDATQGVLEAAAGVGWGRVIRLGGVPSGAGLIIASGLALGLGSCKRCSRKRNEESEGRETHDC